MSSLPHLDIFYVEGSFTQLDPTLSSDIKKYKSLQNWNTAYKILAVATFFFIITTPLFLYLARRMTIKTNDMLISSLNQIDRDINRNFELYIKDEKENVSIDFKTSTSDKELKIAEFFLHTLKGNFSDSKNDATTLFTICSISHQGIHAPLLKTYSKLDGFARNWILGSRNRKTKINIDITNPKKIKISTVFHSTISYFRDGNIYETYIKKDRIIYSLANNNIQLDSDLIKKIT